MNRKQGTYGSDGGGSGDSSSSSSSSSSSNSSRSKYGSNIGRTAAVGTTNSMEQGRSECNCSAGQYNRRIYET
jgi:hypothetical protein